MTYKMTQTHLGDGYYIISNGDMSFVFKLTRGAYIVGEYTENQSWNLGRA